MNIFYCYIILKEYKMYSDIKLKLKKKGIRINEIARATGYGRQTVSNTVHRRQFCQPVQDFISKILNENPINLWGDSYCTVRRLNIEAGKQKSCGKLSYPGGNNKLVQKSRQHITASKK
jgi:lambda repressor-like predicted transcriptional regulator